MSDDQTPFESLRVPLHGFELTVAVDRPVYAAGEAVRITVAATNDADRAVEHVYPGWQRVVLTVRDARHRPVASDEVVGPVPGARTAPEGAFRDRWLPGQLLLLPTWWDQRAGAIRPAWVEDPGVGERVAPGRYRIRASWRGREPGPPVSPPEAWSSWFELV
jgi:hypothetical protein